MFLHLPTQPRLRRALGALAGLAALALAVLLFWWPCLHGGMAPLLGDAQAQMLPWRAGHPPPADARWDALLWDGMAQYYPWRSFAARLAKRGLIPLWNPHQFCGAPFIANGQSAFFYPPNWLFFVVETRRAFGLVAAVHYLLAALSVVLLSRELGLSLGAGVLAAVAFTFGGFMVTWTELPTLMNTAVWLPAGCWAVERTFRRPSLLGPAALGGALAMALLAGHLQIAAYVWLAVGVHLLVRALWGLAGASRAAFSGPPEAGPPPRAGAIPAAAAALMVALGLAALQLVPTMELAQLSSRGRVKPDETGFRFRRARALQPAMLSTLLWPDRLGTPREWAASGVPYSETCGYVGKLTLLLALCGLFGARSRRALLFGALALLALNAAMAGATARFLYYHVPGLGQSGGLARALCVYTFAVALLAGYGADWLRARLADAPPSARLLLRIAPWVPAAAAALIFLDLVVWGRGFLPLSPRSRVYPETRVAARLREGAEQWRVLELTRRSRWRLQHVPDALLPPNSACAYGYDSVQGYDSLRPAAYDRLASRVDPQGFCPVANGNMVLLENHLSEMLDVAAVKWLVVPETEPIRDRGWVEVWHASGVIIYEHPNAPTRVRLVGDRFTLGTELDPAFYPTLVPTGDPARMRCDLHSWIGTHLEIADTLQPGWRAYVGGRRAPILPLPPMFAKVPFTGRPGRIELVYAPSSFAAGTFVSLAALALAMGWIAFRIALGKAGDTPDACPAME